MVSLQDRINKQTEQHEEQHASFGEVVVLDLTRRLEFFLFVVVFVTFGKLK